MTKGIDGLAPGVVVSSVASPQDPLPGNGERVWL